MPRRIMRSFKMVEISGVDNPAQKPATVAIMKRHSDDEIEKYLARNYWTEREALEKRTFSAEERRADAKAGVAEDDGSYPIEDEEDLHDAMRAVGRSKNRSKTKAHIRARAKALGLESKLSDAFKRDGGYAARVGKFFSDLFGKKTDGNVDGVIEKASAGLAESVASILADDNADHATLLTKTFEQFNDHLKEEVAKAMTAGNVVDTGEHDMLITPELKKALGLADTATDAEVTAAIVKVAAGEQKDLKDKLAKAELDLAIAKAAMSDDEKSFHDGLKDEDAKKEFRGASKEDRAARMKKRDDLPADVRKKLEKLDEAEARLAKLENDAALGGFNKQAVDASLPETEGATIQKAYKGDKDAVDKLVGFIKAAHAQVKAAGLFQEIGDNRNGGATLKAYDELMAKAAELRKTKTELSIHQAFSKVCEDPANTELVKREREESRPRAA